MNKVLKPLTALQEHGKSTEKKLLHFGLDWISFNISEKELLRQALSIKFIKSLFRLSHNDTNASEYDGFMWADTDLEVMLHFTGKNHMGDVLMVRYKENAILRIVKVTNMEWRKKFNYQYDYRIDCYGTLFDFHRLGLLNAKEMLSLFLADIANNTVHHSVSRADICADLAGYTVDDIKEGIIGDETHMKKPSLLNCKNKKGAEPETFYYGKKKGKWRVRIYNKLEEVQEKKKTWRFLQLGYFDYQNVTRVEVEMKSEICLEKSLTLPLCFDNEYLFGIYMSLLVTKYVRFKIARFIKSEIKKIGYQIIAPVRRIHDPKQLSELKYTKLAASYHKGLMERCGISFDEATAAIRLHIKPETGISSNPEALATA